MTRERIVVPVAVGAVLLALAARSAIAQVPLYPPSLRGQPVPEPPTIREYVRDPRKALEPESAAAALSRGAYQVLSLLMPYLEPPAREHLLQIAGAYRQHGG